MGKLKEVGLKSTHVLIALLFGTFSVVALVTYFMPDWFSYSFFFSVIPTEFMLIVFGVFIMRLAYKKHIDPRGTKFGLGLFVALFGLFPLLVDFNLLRFLPVHLEMQVNHFLLSVVLLAAVMYFIVDRLHVLPHEEQDAYS